MFIDGNLLYLSSFKLEKKDFYIFLLDIKNFSILIQHWGENKFSNFYLKIFFRNF